MLKKARRNPIQNVARLRTIVSTLAKHGFQDIIEKTGLRKFSLVERLIPAGDGTESAPERLRQAFEELGPTFVKLGQLLATRPDLVPAEYVEEFKRLHDQVSALQFAEIEPSLRGHFGAPIENIFSRFDVAARAAGSIAQVHMAELREGGPVVVKVQRPGIEKVITEDLGVLYFLAELIHRYIPESRTYRPKVLVDEFARALELETNFVIEANNIRRFQENFNNEPNIKIPKVFAEYSGKRVLVLEALEGIPLSQKNALQQEAIDPEAVLRLGLRCYLKMVFSDGLFHGDLHAGNMFVLPNNRIGLIDFGVVKYAGRSCRRRLRPSSL
jgi:ubiquinone biosynthesis protein